MQTTLGVRLLLIPVPETAFEPLPIPKINKNVRDVAASSYKSAHLRLTIRMIRINN